MLKQFVIIVILSNLYTIRADDYDDNTGCTTPTGILAECINIYECQPILNFLKEVQKPISQANTNLLQSYRCNTAGAQVRVCCPPGRIQPVTPRPPPKPQPRPTTPPQPRPQPDSIPDISRHRNLHLLQDACGALPNVDRIINGNKTALFEFPWMALLSYRTRRGTEFKCGGTAINKDYILTAAHCVANLKGGPLIGIRLGEHNIRTETDCENVEYEKGNVEEVCSEPVQDFPIGEVITHPNYSATLYTNDIALIRLKRSANFDVENVKPVCLPIAPSLSKQALKKGTVTGWGQTEIAATSDILLKVDLPVVDNAECQRRYGPQVKITNKQLCAGGSEEKDSCAGDSGGPLQFIVAVGNEPKFVQYGVVSFGPTPCARDPRPGVYTRLVYYMDWILDNMRA